MIIDGKLKINNIPRKEIILALQVANFDEISGSYNYLLSLPIHSLTKENYEELISACFAKEQELETIKQKEPIQMYRDDLQDLRKSVVKLY